MRIRVLLILLIATLGTQAQLMDWGTPQKLASRNFFCKFIGFNHDSYYYLRCKKSDFKSEVSIEKYSRNLSLVWTKPINTGRYGETLEEVLLMQNRLIVLLTSDNYNNGNTELNALELSFDGVLGTVSVPVFQIRTASFYDTEPVHRFIIRMNTNADAFAVCCVTQSDRKIAGVNYNLIDASLTIIGSGGYSYNARSEQFFINDIAINNSDIYCLVSYHESGKRNQEDIYLHDVIGLFSTTKTSSKIPVVLEGKIQSDLGIYIDTAHQNIQLTGFYSEKKSTSAAGVALYTLPLSHPEDISASFTPFPKELIARILGERASERIREVEDFVVNRIVPRSDGGLLLIAECFYIEKQAYNSYSSGIQGVAPQPTTVFRNIYNYDEILVFSIESNASIDWWQVITKNQNSVNDEGYNLSIASLVKKDKVYIFYNLNYHNSNEILEYSISSNGKMKNKILFKSTNYYVDFAPRQCHQIATGSMLIPLIKDRKFNLLKLTY